MVRFLAAAALAAGGALAAAAPAPAEPADLSVTIYNNDLALVQDVRTLEVGKGRQRLEFRDVSASIRPETVALTGQGLGIVEQNFDFDLLTPAKLMEKAVGHEVELVRTGPDGKETRETATVLADNDGVVLKIGGRIEVLRDDGVPTRVIFNGVPENLRAQPTLSVTVDSDHVGPRRASLSYLTKGLSWKADYVAVFDEAKGALDVQGWVTLSNESGTSYPDAKLQLVAGQAQTLDGSGGSADEGPPAGSAGSEESSQGRLGDYYVYPLAQRTTVADKQTKQVGFLEAHGVKARKAYVYRANWFGSLQAPAHAETVLDFANSGAGGLGAPLPAGVMRVYARDPSGEPKFIGESAIGHTPQGSELLIKTGEAFDVTVQPTLVKQDAHGPYRSKYSMSYLVKNARGQPVTVEVRQSGLWRNGKVLEESLKSRRVDARTVVWDVPVAANGETTLTFTVDTGW